MRQIVQAAAHDGRDAELMIENAMAALDKTALLANSFAK
jgi:hypothetical protein